MLGSRRLHKKRTWATLRVWTTLQGRDWGIMKHAKHVRKAQDVITRGCYVPAFIFKNMQHKKKHTTGPVLGLPTY